MPLAVRLQETPRLAVAGEVRFGASSADAEVEAQAGQEGHVVPQCRGVRRVVGLGSPPGDAEPEARPVHDGCLTRSHRARVAREQLLEGIAAIEGSQRIGPVDEDRPVSLSPPA